MNIDNESYYGQADARLPEPPVLSTEDEVGASVEPAIASAETSTADGTSDGAVDDAGSLVPATETGAEPQARSSSRHALREIVETIVITLLVFVVVRLVIQNFKVDGDSMLPTLHSEQYLLVNKALYFRYDANFVSRIFDPSTQPDMHYLFHGPQRGDIVVFLSPTEPLDFIKRVIAMEGETVEIKADIDPVGDPGAPCGGCGVYVNGVKLDEPYIKATPNYSVGPLVVPKGDIYVLGDNRRNSSDSHVWGPLDVGSIVGEAFLSYWPTNEWGLLPHPSYAQTSR
jgi:signal peptidase I